MWGLKSTISGCESVRVGGCVGGCGSGWEVCGSVWEGVRMCGRGKEGGIRVSTLECIKHVHIGFTVTVAVH